MSVIEEIVEEIVEEPIDMNSILVSIRQLITGSKDENFDMDLIIHINGALSIVNQLGVGPEEGFSIIGPSEKWTDFIGQRKDLEMIKTDVHLRVKLVFDPPQNSFLVAAIEKQIQELDWRIETHHPDPLPLTEESPVGG